MVVVAEGDGPFIVAMGCQPLGRTSLTGNEPNVQTTFTTGGKGNVLSVGTPYGIGVVGCIGGQLTSLSARNGNGKQITFVGKSDCLSIWRNGRKTQPQG